jgi:putative flippase GtrA
MNPLGFQISKFAIVGVINTLVDLIFFNIFRRSKKITATVASYLSSTIAMINSYFLNRYWTFSSTSTGSSTEFLKFFLSTIVGIYVIHNGIVWILTNKFKWPGRLALKTVRFIKPLNFMSDTFVTDNFAKVTAIIFSLIWNFILYKFWVFVG